MFFTVLAPTLGWAWPALAPLLGAAAASLGYKVLAEPKGLLRGRLTRVLEQHRLVQVPLDAVLADVIAAELGTEERLRFERDDFVLVFRKDARGKFFVDVLGPSRKSALDLKLRGEEFARELVRKFAYHRVATQLARIGATVLEEQVAATGRVTLRASRWLEGREEFEIQIEPDGRIRLEAHGQSAGSYARLVAFLEESIGPASPGEAADPPGLRLDLRYAQKAETPERANVTDARK